MIKKLLLSIIGVVVVMLITSVSAVSEDLPAGVTLDVKIKKTVTVTANNSVNAKSKKGKTVRSMNPKSLPMVCGTAMESKQMKSHKTMPTISGAKTDTKRPETKSLPTVPGAERTTVPKLPSCH